MYLGWDTSSLAPSLRGLSAKLTGGVWKGRDIRRFTPCEIAALRLGRRISPVVTGGRLPPLHWPEVLLCRCRTTPSVSTP